MRAVVGMGRSCSRDLSLCWDRLGMERGCCVPGGSQGRCHCYLLDAKCLLCAGPVLRLWALNSMVCLEAPVTGGNLFLGVPLFPAEESEAESYWWLQALGWSWVLQIP